MERGKTENFSAAQAAVIRDAVKRIRAERSWSQERLATEIGIGQQSMGRIEKMGGATYAVASKIAQLAGFAGLDALFEAHGVAFGQGKAQDDDPWPPRRDAARFARAKGIPSHVIESVRAKYSDQLFRDRTTSWWGLQFQKAYVAELELQEELRAVAEQKKSGPSAPERVAPPAKKSRKAG